MKTVFQPSKDKEFNTPACAYKSFSSEPSNGVFFVLNSICHRALLPHSTQERSHLRDLVFLGYVFLHVQKSWFWFSVCDNPAKYYENMALYKCCLCGTHRKRLTALNVKFKSWFRFVCCVRLRLNQQMAPWTCFNRIREYSMLIFSFWMVYCIEGLYINHSNTFLRNSLHIRKKIISTLIRGQICRCQCLTSHFLLVQTEMRCCEESVVEKTFETLRSATFFLN